MQPKGGMQLPGTTTLLVAICMSMLFLLLTTGSNYLLEASFGFFTSQQVLTSLAVLDTHDRSSAAPSIPNTSLSTVDTHDRSSIAPAIPNTSLSSTVNTHDRSSIAPAIPNTSFSTESTKDVDVGETLEWLKLRPIFNYTQKYLALIAQNGSKPCHDLTTSSAHLFGLPKPKEGEPYIRLKCGIIHELTLIAFDEFGRRRCAGGDFFETDVSGLNWKSRPPITDLENGSYSILLQMHPKFAGIYDFKIILGFSNYHGLHRRPEKWFRNETVVDLHIEFVGEESSPLAISLPRLSQCTTKDFELDAWTGRWVRSKYNRRCSVDNQGRFRCLGGLARCDDPWCWGPIGALESNGWVYSAHCAFRIFTEDDAWTCLNKKWIFFWGDSNHVDTIRNFLNFVLGFENITEVPRRFDTAYVRPQNPSQFVRITSMFNGHSDVSLNHEGLFSLHNVTFREQVAAFFREGTAPDAVILNSGLHDGMYWKHLHHFVEQGVDNAVDFWASLLNGLKGEKPRVIYRTTITTAAWARAAAFNPYKMEVFNNIFVKKLKKANLLWGVVDDFDLTYPWHFDNNCSDGVHYGKAPAATKWYGQLGHQYFVDLMLVHILLHAVCTS